MKGAMATFKVWDGMKKVLSVDWRNGLVGVGVVESWRRDGRIYSFYIYSIQIINKILHAAFVSYRLNFMTNTLSCGELAGRANQWPIVFVLFLSGFSCWSLVKRMLYDLKTS
jgi:hypothetical protein